MTKDKQNFFTLNNGVEIPAVGFGTFQIAPEKTQQAVAEAISAGYRLIDTSQLYMNENQVGLAIKESPISREELFITSKLWIDAAGYAETFQAFERSLENLQLDYLDLYLIHQPLGDIYGSWRALCELQKQGRIRAIGISNFETDQFVNFVLSNETRPQINQIEINPWNQRKTEIEYMEKYQMQPEAFSSFAQGQNDLFQNGILAKIGQSHGKTIGQVVLRWLFQQNIVSLSKTTHKKRMVENIAIFDFELSEHDMQEISALNLNQTAFTDPRNPQLIEGLHQVKLNK